MTQLQSDLGRTVFVDEVNDPLGAMIHKLNAVNRQVAELQTKLAKQQEQQELAQQYQQFAENVKSLRNEFTKANPDFDDAYKHLHGIRIADLMDTGMTKAQATQALHRQELELAASALERGKNPAEVIYGMAKRYGYTGKAAAVPEGKPAAPAQKAAEEKVQRLANGQFAAKAPARAAAPASEGLTVEGLKDASDSDLTRVALDDSAWNRIVGGKGVGDIFQH